MSIADRFLTAFVSFFSDVINFASAEILAENSYAFLDKVYEVSCCLKNFVWSLPFILFILFVGIFLTFFLRFKHIFNLGHAFKCMFMRENDLSAKGDVSHFGALCTSLSATIGTGNIVGVAMAITTGGPGALFWMEVAAFFGMATKFAEGLLAIKYREVTKDGRILGGAFYYIEKGLGKQWKFLAIFFAISGIFVGLFGIGTMTQSNGITTATAHLFNTTFNLSNFGIVLFGTKYSLTIIIPGLIVTICVALVIIGGIQRIAKVSSFVVPFMALSYVAMIMFLLFDNYASLPAAIKLIFNSAFNPEAFTGGVIGSLLLPIQQGVARGIFSNEAGLGSASIAAAAAKTKESVRQGLVCMLGTFIDTIIICTMTGLAIVVTDVWYPSVGLEGANVTLEAFTRGLSFFGKNSAYISSLFLTLSLMFFAFTTILGWNYYAERCLEYLVGSNRKTVIKIFRIFFVLMVFIGPYISVSYVWLLADIVNGFMALPNLIALVFLSPIVVKTTKDYFTRLKRG